VKTADFYLEYQQMRAWSAFMHQPAAFTFPLISAIQHASVARSWVS